jgi:hypothetical protein
LLIELVIPLEWNLEILRHLTPDLAKLADTTGIEKIIP